MPNRSGIWVSTALWSRLSLSPYRGFGELVEALQTISQKRVSESIIEDCQKNRRLVADTGDLPTLLCLRAACGDTIKGNCVLATSASRSQISQGWYWDEHCCGGCSNSHHLPFVLVKWVYASTPHSWVMACWWILAGGKIHLCCSLCIVSHFGFHGTCPAGAVVQLLWPSWWTPAGVECLQADFGQYDDTGLFLYFGTQAEVVVRCSHGFGFCVLSPLCPWWLWWFGFGFLVPGFLAGSGCYGVACWPVWECRTAPNRLVTVRVAWTAGE